MLLVVARPPDLRERDAERKRQGKTFSLYGTNCPSEPQTTFQMTMPATVSTRPSAAWRGLGPSRRAQVLTQVMARYVRPARQDCASKNCMPLTVDVEGTYSAYAVELVRHWTRWDNFTMTLPPSSCDRSSCLSLQKELARTPGSCNRPEPAALYPVCGREH